MQKVQKETDKCCRISVRKENMEKENLEEYRMCLKNKTKKKKGEEVEHKED